MQEAHVNSNSGAVDVRKGSHREDQPHASQIPNLIPDVDVVPSDKIVGERTPQIVP